MICVCQGGQENIARRSERGGKLRALFRLGQLKGGVFGFSRRAMWRAAGKGVARLDRSFWYRGLLARVSVSMGTVLGGKDRIVCVRWVSDSCDGTGLLEHNYSCWAMGGRDGVCSELPVVPGCVGVG